MHRPKFWVPELRAFPYAFPRGEFEREQPGDQGGIFNGNPLVTAADYAVLNEVLKPGFLQNVKHKSEFLLQCLNNLAKKHKLGEVRGCGLLLALDTQIIDATIIVKHAFEQKLLLNAPRKNSLRFMPALTVTTTEIEQIIELLDSVLSAMLYKQ